MYFVRQVPTFWGNLLSASSCSTLKVQAALVDSVIVPKFSFHK